MSKRSACQERRLCDRPYLRREARSPGRPCNLQILKDGPVRGTPTSAGRSPAGAGLSLTGGGRNSYSPRAELL